MINKKILHVVNIYFVLPYFIGDQFLYFKEKGYELNVICSPSKYLADYANKMGFNYLEVKILRAIKPLKDLIAIYTICNFIKKNKIDIVVGHTPKGALLAMLAARIMGVPRRVYFRHGLVYETMHGIQRSLMINIDRLSALCSTKVVCVSQYIYSQSLKDRLNSEKKQIVLGKGTCGGIDSITKFNPAYIELSKINQLKVSLGIKQSDFVIGFCGRLVIDKGIIELVESFYQLKKESNRKYKLLLVGDFEQRNSLPKYIIDKIKYDEDIIVTGFVFSNIEYYYALMNLYILPSYREGFGISVLEASSMQLPVLTTKATGCKDSIIEGNTGFYVLNTINSITNAIKSLRDDKNITIYGLNGRKFVLKFFDNRILWPILEKELYS